MRPLALFSADSVVEVAVVTMDRTGATVDGFECLINLPRDPGPTWLFGRPHRSGTALEELR
ncbi:hypothetical protein [Mycobacteroides franklinii]|uniref:Uncharacterized protein n=1 Tax=Mycobacteroides franklinii TaxID=948102 RepID=A0A4R5PDC9_9MYCO|nr:hypothetical protein [Mycobacteroides franklinii]ORA63020.1 hypothetical protein BST24_05135 [Mycobacteroides franklinii]TDH22430.1 hypothetical protein EJ571_10970 [Mycobacteroides franklinii]